MYGEDRSYFYEGIYQLCVLILMNTVYVDVDAYVDVDDYQYINHN